MNKNPFDKFSPEAIDTAFGNVLEHINGEIEYFKDEGYKEAAKVLKALYKEIEKMKKPAS